MNIGFLEKSIRTETPSSHEVLRFRPRAGVFSRPGCLSRAYADQCIHAGGSFIFWYSSSSLKAGKMRAADGSKVAAAAEGQSLGINFPGPFPLPSALEAGAQQRARKTR
jgi:hypothetical protein